jgi:hypothetical protein
VGGSVIGASGTQSAYVYAEAGSGAITIGKNLQGGSGSDSGFLAPEYGPNGQITIRGSVLGGGGSYSGAIYVEESSLTSVIIKGNLQGGAGANSGEVYSDLDLKSLAIGGGIIGGAGSDSGSVISYQDIVHMTVGGGVASGTGALSGAIQSGKHIVSLSIGGDVIGTATSNVEIIAEQAIDSLAIGGKLSFSQVLAGYTASDSNTAIKEYSAQATIGTVTIGGNFEASSIVAGASAGTDGLFGNSDDHLIANASSSISNIASVVIGGSVLGTAATTDHFGIEAANVDFVKIGTTVEPLTPGPSTIELLSTTTNDVTIRQL